MPDPVERLSAVDRVPVPDLWSRIEAGEATVSKPPRSGRLLAGVVGIAVAAAGLGFGLYAFGHGHRTIRDVRPPRTVVVTRDDFGKTTTLSVGQHLLITLHRPIEHSQWELVRYPKGTLALSASAAGRGRFEFTATAPGRGVIGISEVIDCGPPIPAAKESAAGGPAALASVARCPVAAGGRSVKVPLELLLLRVAVL